MRRRAAETVVRSADASVAPLREIVDDPSRTLDDRLAALWTLCQVGTPEAISTAADHLDSTEASLAQAACHIVSIHRYQAATPSLLELLHHPSPQVKRTAAEGLGRIGDEGSIEPLLDALEESDGERHLEHSLVYALVEVTRRNPSIDLRKRATSDTRLLAAILVLEQLDRGGELDPPQLFKAAFGHHAPLRRAAIDVLSSHPEWAADANENLQSLWLTLDSNPDAGNVLAEIASGWHDEPSMAHLVGGWISAAVNASPHQHAFLAENMSLLSKHALWPEWSQSIADWIEQASPDVQSALASSLAQLDLSGDAHVELIDRVVRLASQTEGTTLRLKLLASVPLKSRIADGPAEQEVVASFVDPDGTLTDLASKVLLQCKLSKSQSQQLVESLPTVTPQHLMTAIEVIHRAGIAEVEEAMLDQLRAIPAARTLPRGFLTNLYSQAEKPLRDQAAVTTGELESPPEDIQRAVNAMLEQLSDGDPVRGLQVFRGQRASCSGCHKMGYIGKEIGPDLTRIGRSRTAEALMEAILFPSARLEQSYQSTRVLTIDGQIHNGLLVSQAADSVELQLNAERKIVLPRDEIERMEASDVSVMPQGIDKVLSKQELADLLALLQSAQ